MSNILVVDDEPGIRSLMALALNGEGFSVLTAESGAEAISISEAHRGEIGLLITDVVMPGMNGPELAAELRAVDPDLPVLFISGYCESAQLESCGHGIDLLTKPFSMTALVAEVRNRVRSSARTPAS